jgi:hypothetical protein
MLNDYQNAGQSCGDAQTEDAGSQRANVEPYTKEPPPAGALSSLPAGDGGGRPATRTATSLGTPPTGANPARAGGGEAVQPRVETHSSSDRFADPLIGEIVETWRARQDMVRAQQKLTLQAKAICRRFSAGDRVDAERLYRAVAGKGEHPLREPAGRALLGLLAARCPLEDQRAAYEKHLARLARGLPIAGVVANIRGVGLATLAAIVGELGDLGAYEKGVAGIWKRAGLAVIGGERQRKKAGDAALEHGYAPGRHAVFWNVGAALLKAQGKNAGAGPYRRIYDARKAYERPRVVTDAHAHNRAMRYMTKRLLRDLWVAWRDATIDCGPGPARVAHEARPPALAAAVMFIPNGPSHLDLACDANVGALAAIGDPGAEAA